MWKALSSISALLLLGAAGVTYFNTENYKEEVNLKTQSDSILKDAQGHLDERIAAKDNLQGEDGESGLLLQTTEERDKYAEQASETKTTMDEQTSEIEQKETLLEEKKAELAEWEDKIKDLGGIDQMKLELAKLTESERQLVAQIGSKKTTLNGALSVKATTENALNSKKRAELNQQTGKMDGSFRVRSVNSQWGFAVLSAGHNNSVVANAKLQVKRSGSIVGDLRVRSVESSSAIADIVSGSARPGDLVIVHPDSRPDPLQVVTASSADSVTMSAPEPSSPAELTEAIETADENVDDIFGGSTTDDMGTPADDTSGVDVEDDPF